MIQTIGFDADDTLWQNEHLYADARRKYDAILRSSASVNGHGIPANLDDIVHEIEVGNLPYYGYGITSFVMSLIETAIRVTDGRITGRELGEIQDIAKQMVAAEVELLDAVEETLADLSADYPLILITKGDLLHQQKKVARSGIEHYFVHVEVVSEKSPESYAQVLRRLDIIPERFVMVGNSMRSDILPVTALGGRGIYVPNDQTWHFENADLPEDAAESVIEANGMREVPALIRRLDSDS
ncbi:MAG: HAD family hydrolase [Chloroflexota bacterium]